MSYLIYNGKRVIAQNKYVGKWSFEIPQQIYFTSGGSVDFASVPVVTGIQTIKWDMLLDASVASKIYVGFVDGVSNDYIYANYDYLPSFEQTSTGITYPVLRVQVKNSPGVYVRIYNIDSYIGVNTNIEIVKGTGSITSVKANNNTLTTLYSGSVVYDTGGSFSYAGGNGGASIWNLEIVGSHKWIGYPYGNTNAAWVDTIGSIDGTVTGSPGTRNVL